MPTSYAACANAAAGLGRGFEDYTGQEGAHGASGRFAFDWVLSIEMAEHIPPQFEATFLDNLDRANERAHSRAVGQLPGALADPRGRHLDVEALAARVGKSGKPQRHA